MSSRSKGNTVATIVLICLSAARASGAVFNIPNGDVAALKNAIIIANGNGQADTINLAAGGLYILTTVDNGTGSDANGLPVVTTGGGADLLTINGNGATIQRSPAAGTPEFRIFSVRSITISNLGIAYGSEPGDAVGGGLAASEGPVTLTNCTLAGNSARLGGGVFQEYGSISLTGCLLASNSAEDGGGLFLVAQTSAIDAQLSNCTFSDNSASGSGAAIFASAESHALNITLAGCTVSNNHGSESIYLANAHGMALVFTIGNTILHGGPPGSFGSTLIGGSFVASAGYNLCSDRADGDLGTGPGGWLDGPGDIRNTIPQLGPLQNNGGPTFTHAPKIGSPLIDKGKRDAVVTLPVTTDQRGLPRPFDDPAIAPASGGDNTDIGAVELQFAYQAGPIFTVNTMADHDDAACSTSDCTLREAIQAGNNTPGSHTIRFAPSLIGILQLESVLPNLRTSGSIEGPGPNLLTVRRNNGGEYRIFTISNDTTGGPLVSISGLTITNGQVPFNDAGGGILNDHGDLIVTNCVITGNSATRGGGICSDIMGADGSVSVINSTLSNNTAPSGYGGAIFNAGGSNGTGTASLTNCTLSGNSAQGSFGGALYNAGSNGGIGTMSLTNCTLSDNAASNGGGIYNFNFNGSAAVLLANTILKAGNSGANLANSAGAITSQGHNLSSDNGNGFLTGTGDQLNTNPQLGPLQSNGGLTPTHALLGGSLAINMGDNALAPPMDQRGYGRNAVSDVGAFEFNGVAPPVQLLGAVSRKMHGAAGSFDVNLPLIGTPGVECRSGGAGNDYQVVFTFNSMVTFNNASITSGTGSVSSSSGSGSATVTVNLTGVTSGQTITVTLAGVNNGSSMGNFGVSMGVLLGDTSGNGSVNASDVSQTKSKTGQAVDVTNFRTDVSVNNLINASDVSLVKSKSGTTLPVAPDGAEFNDHKLSRAGTKS